MKLHTMKSLSRSLENERHDLEVKAEDMVNFHTIKSSSGSLGKGRHEVKIKLKNC